MFRKYLVFFCVYYLLINSITVYSQVNVIPIGSRKINLDESLSQGRVLSIVEDHKGLIWIGTLDGLNSYDGYNVEVFRHVPTDSTSISNNTINSLCIDDSSFIWIGTENGLNLLNPNNKVFKSFFEKNSKYERINANQIVKVLIDNKGAIWLATAGAGIVKFNSKTGERTYVSLNLDTANVHNNVIIDFDIDSYGNIWFANSDGENGRVNSEHSKIEYINVIGRQTEKPNYYANAIYINSSGKVLFTLSGKYIGLYYYDKAKNLIVEDFNFNNQLKDDIFNSQLTSVGSLLEDWQGNLWISSLHSGIFKYSNDGTISYYPDYIVNKPGDRHFEGYGVKCVYFSKSGVLWIGSNGYGLSSVNDFNFKFNTIRQGGFAPDFVTKSVRAIYEDKAYFWIGGYYGLVRLNKLTNNIKPFLVGTSIYKICPDKQDSNFLYIGTEGDGIYRYKKSSNDFEKFFYTKSKGSGLGSNVYEINQQGDSILWIGRNSGLEKLNLKSKKSVNIRLESINNQNLNNNFTVLSSLIDNNNKAWFGTLKSGLWYLDTIRNVLVHKEISLLNQNMPPVRINAISQDSKGSYWVSTGNGLYLSQDMESGFKLFTTENGLPNDFIYACLEDDIGDYWISSNKGLSNYNPEESTFTNYQISSGLSSDEFNTGAYYKARDGSLFFGGVDGITYFQPKYLSHKKSEYPLLITKTHINNKEVIPTQDTDGEYQVELSEYDENLSVEFAYLSFLGEKRNDYEYRIVKPNSTWIKLGSSNHIIIEKPNSGKEKYEIRARIRGGMWDENSVFLKVDKKPYLWQTWYFWAFVFVSVVILVAVYIKRRLYIIKKEKHKLESLVDERTKSLKISNEKLRETNATKDRLFSIIAHDLRNPLNSLLGFTSLIHTQSEIYTEEEIHQFIATIYVSSKNMNTLLDNLLGWSRLQMDKLKPSIHNLNVNSIIESNLLFLDGNIREKEIAIYFDEKPSYSAYVDNDILSLITRNILSNAIKYTDFQGSINIKVFQNDEFIVISIKDDGVGMDERTLKILFSDEINFTNVGTNKEKGTGLGLVLCKDFIEIINGKIEVKSTLGSGSEFLIYVPKAK